MNASVARWLAGNPVGAILVTVVLALLPAIAFVLPGAVVAFVTLQRGPRVGTVVALVATVLLVAPALWSAESLLQALALPSNPLGPPPLLALGPPLALGVLLARRQSLSLCLQIAVLLGVAAIVVLHMSLGDPLTFWQSEVRAIEQTMLQHEMPHAQDVSTVLRAFDPFARWFWGLAAAQALLLSMCALFLARKWQASGEQPGAFGAEFRSLRLGLALGVAAAGFVALSAWVANDLVDEIAIVFSVALLLVGLAAAHRFRATSGQHVAWLWVMYIALFSPISPLVIGALVTWGFIDNWLRSSRRAATA